VTQHRQKDTHDEAREAMDAAMSPFARENKPRTKPKNLPNSSGLLIDRGTIFSERVHAEDMRLNFNKFLARTGCG
jgi:hypothetical protein